MQPVNLLDAPVHAASFAEALGELERRATGNIAGYFSNANAYSLSLAQEREDLARVLRGAAFVMADGMPVVWALRAMGHAAERVHGDDFFLAYLSRHPRQRHFLLGGAPGQPEEVAKALADRFPGVCVVGTRATPVRPLPEEERRRALEQIEAARAQVVWVGMGTPAQDLFMADVSERLGVPLVGVGSAFDLLSGRTSATPEWMKRAGLQWLYRLSQEPGRLAPRYLKHNPRFAVLAARDIVSARRRG